MILDGTFIQVFNILYKNNNNIKIDDIIINLVIIRELIYLVNTDEVKKI